MFEYRYGEIAEETFERLSEMGIYPIEEEFNNEEKHFIIYGGDDITGLIETPYISKTPVEETGWDEKWKEFIKPGYLTETLKYSFDTENEPDNDTILINPSMAFGTGTHPTTKCAARLLEKVCFGKTVLDAGCGSGILSIAAVKRGAAAAYAFDTDPVALVNVKENLKLNNIDNISAWAGGIESFRGSVQVAAANIITSVLKLIHPHILDLKPEYIVYSGILHSEFEEFISEIDLSDYSIAETVCEQEWTGVVFKCR